MMEKYQEMWTMQAGEWVVICDHPDRLDDCETALLYHVPTDGTMIIEQSRQALYVARKLKDAGSIVTDEHPVLRKKKKAPSRLKQVTRWIASLWP